MINYYWLKVVIVVGFKKVSARYTEFRIKSILWKHFVVNSEVEYLRIDFYNHQLISSTKNQEENCFKPWWVPSEKIWKLSLVANWQGHATIDISYDDNNNNSSIWTIADKCSFRTCTIHIFAYWHKNMRAYQHMGPSTSISHHLSMQN